MSMPAIRAIRIPVLLSLDLALALLVARVLADHHDAAVPADDLALLTHLLDAGSNLHDCFSLEAVGDATSGEVVRGELHLHLVAGKDSDVVHPHLAGDVRQHLVAVVELDTEHGIGQRLQNRAFQHDGVFLGLGQGFLLTGRWGDHDRKSFVTRANRDRPACRPGVNAIGEPVQHQAGVVCYRDRLPAAAGGVRTVRACTVTCRFPLVPAPLSWPSPWRSEAGCLHMPTRECRSPRMPSNATRSTPACASCPTRATSSPFRTTEQRPA